MIDLVVVDCPSGQIREVVSWLLVDLVALAEDIGLVDLLCPILYLDFFDCNGNRFFAVIENGHYVLGNAFGQSLFCICDFPGQSLTMTCGMAFPSEPST